MKSPSLQDIMAKVEALEGEIRLYRSVVEVIQEPFFILDRKGGFLKANPKGMETLGYPWEDLRKMVFTDVVALEELSRVSEGLGEMKQGQRIRLKTLLVSRRGEPIPAELFGTVREESVFISLIDLRERIEAEEEWERSKKALTEKIRERNQYARELQALKDLYREKVREIERMKEDAVLLSYVDDLTGIYNHRFFIQQLTLEVERQKRYPSPLCLLMMDIDYFKHYNDTNGHLAGDQALKGISILIRHAVRQTDIVARYGGEEFSAILINTVREGAREIAERIRRNVAETRFPNEKAQPGGDLTISIGVSAYSPSVSSITDLIREADNALYLAKKRGRNRVEG